MIRYAARIGQIGLTEAGAMTTLALEGVRATWRVRQWWGEFLEQCWFLISVTMAPVLLIAVPLGATISLQVGDIARQLGAQAATGGVIVMGTVREVAPVAAALLISGAGGSAIAADMGARNIRDELSAMEVMGVNPIHRLVTPRLWASCIVSTLLVSVIVFSGVLGGYVFNVLFQGTTPGAYFTGATLLLQLPDVLQSLFKAWVFGFIAGVVACSRGMRCGRGAVGVGRAVNRAVVITFVLVFFANYVITTLYLVLIPQRM
jgi:phospholipid/cholesterol/gamma-HCH transport system permease protein